MKKQLDKSLVPSYVDQKHAEKHAGFRWMAYNFYPVTGAPSCRQLQRVRQFFSPEQLADSRWKEFLDGRQLRDAEGSEPLTKLYETGKGIADYPQAPAQ